MAEPKDMIMPMLREMRDNINTRFNQMDSEFHEIKGRLAGIESNQKSFKNALVADTMMSKYMTGDFEERIGALEEKIERLIARVDGN